ncbi:hypothetical protein QBC39DRAFT_355134 [Podospora conica]|nr:hypothetical protein QBC39DRAFT_355134 [Schizothecium conicum]
MAAAMGSTAVSPPDIRTIALPLLSCLPGAAVSAEPATTVLPLLSPILRQRVQLLSGPSTEPWIRLLTYDTSAVPRLTELAQSGSLEPHPVSGEIEVDWDWDVQIKYRRLDQETIQTLVALGDFGLFLRLVYCVGDKEGGGDGWRLGEVGVLDGSRSALSAFGGFDNISEAESAFSSQNLTAPSNKPIDQAGLLTVHGSSGVRPAASPAADDDEDDDYWGRYDATPSRTPAAQRSPAPQPTTQASQPIVPRSQSAEDAYYAQYDSVQPAMDPHDPDEEFEEPQAPPPLGLARPKPVNKSPEGGEVNETSGAWTLAEPPKSRSPSVRSAAFLDDEERAAALVHPRPESSASSNGPMTVAKLEETAAKLEEYAEKRRNYSGVQKHVSDSIRSLLKLSRAMGIDRDEFEMMVEAELKGLPEADDV